MAAADPLIEAAQAELDQRRRSYGKRMASAAAEATAEMRRDLAAWTTVEALLRHGETPFDPCLGETNAIAWSELLAAVQKALEHRAAREETERYLALKQIRSRLIRPAVRAGATFPVVGAPARLTDAA